ncbi:unnamed protein product [Cylindrotheca closterium]|uniref:YEATS domain-containing protein n=1 Tax=Cylindrotheca closterium TaxID=2856 RepID=A0AAD2G2H2_9STRA|nr:unnamed protein product [Cylindrotheca closterium]
MAHSVDFIVGNTYARIPNHIAKRSRVGGHRKIHDVTVFVDVVNDGNPDLLDKVSFDCGATFSPQIFTCACPIPTQTRNGTSVWRFSTRQQVYGPFDVKIKIYGAGGTTLVCNHEVQLKSNSEIMAHREPEMNFVEYKRLRPLSKIRLPDGAQFGIELEMSSGATITPEYLAYELSGDNRYQVQAYDYTHATVDHWKIVPDSSIVCNRSEPDCNKFELVSPPLGPGAGLTQVHAILSKVTNVNVKVNKSMGFHVHVNVSRYSVPQLVKVCQQFVKYEAVMDLLMPPSRRTGSVESNQFFASNRRHVENLARNSRRSVIDTLANCEDLQSLVYTMNGATDGSGRYFKLNLQNLVTGRQPTIEFRQHSATFEYEKVRAWIRFCVLLTSNAAKLRAPTSFSSDKTVDEQLEALFQYVLKDRDLRNYYRSRAQKHNHADPAEAACCDECRSAPNSVSSSSHRPAKQVRHGFTGFCVTTNSGSI